MTTTLWNDIPCELWQHIMTTYVRHTLVCVASVCREWRMRLPGPYRSYAFESISIHDWAGRPEPMDYEHLGSVAPLDVIMRFPDDGNACYPQVEGAAQARRWDIVKELYRRIPKVTFFCTGLHEAFKYGDYEMVVWILTFVKYDEWAKFDTSEACVWNACTEHWDMVLRLAETFTSFRYFALQHAICNESVERIEELFALFDGLDARPPWDYERFQHRHSFPIGTESPFLEAVAVLKCNMDLMESLHRHNIIAALTRECLIGYLNTGNVSVPGSESLAAVEWVVTNF